MALAAPEFGQNDTADRRDRCAGKTTRRPVCTCSGRAPCEARGIMIPHILSGALIFPNHPVVLGPRFEETVV
eukprot:9435102-Pyramimonas_sp.AAC.1